MNHVEKKLMKFRVSPVKVLEFFGSSLVLLYLLKETFFFKYLPVFTYDLLFSLSVLIFISTLLFMLKAVLNNLKVSYLQLFLAPIIFFLYFITFILVLGQLSWKYVQNWHLIIIFLSLLLFYCIKERQLFTKQESLNKKDLGLILIIFVASLIFFFTNFDPKLLEVGMFCSYGLMLITILLIMV